MNATLAIVRRPTGSQWRLGSLPVAIGDLMLLRWSLPVHPVDGGMPGIIAPVVAGALAEGGRLTFMDSERMDATGTDWTIMANDLVRVVRPTLAQRFRLRLARLPTSFTQVSTRATDSVLRIFDDGGFPWWMGSQAALVSAPDQPPPCVTADQFLALLDDDWATTAASLRPMGVDAVVRAGVDGDVMGILSLRPGVEARISEALHRVAEQAGFECVEQAEPRWT